MHKENQERYSSAFCGIAKKLLQLNWFLFFIVNNKEALLCCSICRSLLASKIQSESCPIPALYAKIPDFYCDIFFPSVTVGFLNPWPWRVRAWYTIEGGGGRGHTNGRKPFADMRVLLFGSFLKYFAILFAAFKK